MKYTIHDFELAKMTEVEAPGFLEAILEYLPWPTLQLGCDYQPSHGRATFIDWKTKFKYEVTISS